MPFQTSFSETPKLPSSVEGIQTQLEELKACINQYQAHSSWLNKEGGTVISKHFQKLFRKWRTSRNTILQATPTKVKEDALTQWENFTQASHPTDADKTRMLREGLTSETLLNHIDFIDWLKKWDYSQRLCFRWLHTCIWHSLLLKPKPLYSIHESFLALYNQALENAPLDFPKHHHAEWHRFYQAFRTQELPQILQRHCESLLQKLLDSDCSLEEAPQWLADELKLQLGLLQALSPQHPLVEDLVGQYFTTALKRYIHTEATDKPKLLDKLLNTFCHGLKIQETARKRFQVLWQALGFSEGRYTTEERQCVQSFCLSQLEDPRLAPHNWLPLKQLDEPMYQRLLFWFNEADFNLFFKFAFHGSPDLHGRQEFWHQYLHLATDFRVIVSSQLKRHEFIKIANKELGYTAIQPFVNKNGTQTGEVFVLRMGDALVCEFTKEGNAVYIYNKSKIRPQSHTGKLIAQLLEEPKGWEREISGILLKNTELAENATTWIHTYLSHAHWRFSHTGYWQARIKAMLEECYDLLPN